MRILYTWILTLLLPLILARLFWRSFQQRGYRQHIGERFGSYRQPMLRDCIWVHAVSVGETRAAVPLIRRLITLHPGRPILLTSMTPTGRATALELFGDNVTCTYLPYDLVALHQRLIDHFQPSVLLVMETEIWPNLLGVCEKNTIPVLIVNARLSEKSSLGYARFAAIRALVRQALRSVQVVAAQAAADAERFRRLGAQNIAVTGNIKFDISLDAVLMKLGEDWRARLGNRRVLLCASTRDGEEALLLAAYRQVFDAAERRNTLLLMVPRHPQRFDRVTNEIESAGLRFIRRSQGMPDAADEWPDVCLGDSMGEMAAYYSFSDVVIIGGSFLPLGGQNLIEACALGKPVIMGPSTYNFSEATRLARDAGAMLQVRDATEAMRTAQRLLRDEPSRKTMSDAGLKLVAANRGATEKTIALVQLALAACRT